MSATAKDKELFEEFAAKLAASVEGMTMERPAVSWDPLPAAPTGEALRWRQPLGSLGNVWVIATEADWMAAGRMVLLAAGIEESDAAEYRSTFLELNNQALGGLAQILTKMLKREILPAGGTESKDAPGAGSWAEFHVKSGDISYALVVGMEEAFLTSLAQAMTPPPPPPAAAQAAPGQAMVAAAGASDGGSQSSKTFDLLLDVELPVSVSFGRAQIPLKDVLKLATGSIVELNRAISEPVEIIVNNCVIARGEVVVVDGNFGVRIQAVISRQERLRTLQ